MPWKDLTATCPCGRPIRADESRCSLCACVPPVRFEFTGDLADGTQVRVGVAVYPAARQPRRLELLHVVVGARDVSCILGLTQHAMLLDQARAALAVEERESAAVSEAVHIGRL